MRIKHILFPFAMLALFALPCSALAAANHPFLNAFPTTYEDACGVALRGGLYVSAYYQNAVFTPSAKLSPESESSGPCKIDLDAAGNLYVDNWHSDVVKYSSGELLPEHGTVIDSAESTGLWIEQATGDLYVAHRANVSKYSSAGTLLQTIGTGELEEAYGVAVSEFPETAGEIYVPDAATNTVKIFNSSGTLVNELDGTNTAQGGFTYLKDGEVAVDNNSISPSYGHVFVLDAIGHGLSERPPAVFDEFNSKGAYRGQVTGFTDAEPSGVAIDPNPGATNGDLYITSGNSEGSQVFQYGPTAPAKNLTVLMEGTGHGTVTSSPRGITCGSHCLAEFDEGQSVSLFANPDAHSIFTGWTVTGSEPCPGGEGASCTVLMAKNVEVKATFSEPSQETLTLTANGGGSVTSSPEGISCPSACSEHFAQGRTVTLKATPAAHHRLAGWSGCTVQANPVECKVTMTEAKAVSVSFESIAQLPLSVSLAGTGEGGVTTFPPGISCPGTCSSSYDQGSTIYLMAAPSPGSEFVGFAGGGCSGSATLCAVSMSAAQNITATFGGTAAGPTHAAAIVSLRVISIRTGPTGALLTVKTFETGTLLAFGRGLRPLKRSLSAGTTTVALRLGRTALRRLARRGHLALHLALGFIPASGGTPAAQPLRLRFSHSGADVNRRVRRR